MDLTWVKTIINGCKTFAASIAQTLVDKQVKFQILSYKLGLGKSLTGLGLRKFQIKSNQKVLFKVGTFYNNTT